MRGAESRRGERLRRAALGGAIVLASATLGVLAVACDQILGIIEGQVTDASPGEASRADAAEAGQMDGGPRDAAPDSDAADAPPESGSNWIWVPKIGSGTDPPTRVIAVGMTSVFASVTDKLFTGDLVEFSLCGTEPRLRTTAALSTGNIVADDTFFYWGVYLGKIYRMAR
jgi:hypothetical protein